MQVFPFNEHTSSNTSEGKDMKINFMRLDFIKPGFMKPGFMILAFGALIIYVSLFFSVVEASGQVNDYKPLRPVHTYSIVARDPITGDMGVAVQSHWFSIGNLVPWAQAGVGAVATQSFIDVRYGVQGLKLMRTGKSASQALYELKKSDAHPEVRQVAMIDAKGNVAAHTGKACIRYAGHKIGKNFSVQANLMINDGVVQAMEKAYLNSKGTLADRLITALEAAQSIGGDLRGKQSAAVLVVRGTPTGKLWEDRLVDLHVEDHPTPLKELRRLMNLHKAYDHMNKGDLAIEQKNIDGALREYGAAQALAPENLEMKFWHAVSLVNANRVKASLPIFKTIFKKDKNWQLLVPRLSEVNVLPADKAVIDTILSVAPAR